MAGIEGRYVADDESTDYKEDVYAEPSSIDKRDMGKNHAGRGQCPQGLNGLQF